jgi:hypothetical protein
MQGSAKRLENLFGLVWLGLEEDVGCDCAVVGRGGLKNKTLDRPNN